MNITLTVAILNVIRDFRNQGQSFSAHDVTRKIREYVNTDVITISDIDDNTNSNENDTSNASNVSFVTKVEHSRVRQLVAELFNNKHITGFTRRSKTTSEGVTYSSYEPAGADSVANSTANPTANPTANSSDNSTTNPTANPTANPNARVNFIIASYLKNKTSRGEKPTLKSVQSRLKRETKISTFQIKNLVRSLGYRVCLVYGQKPSHSVIL